MKIIIYNLLACILFISCNSDEDILIQESADVDASIGSLYAMTIARSGDFENDSFSIGFNNPKNLASSYFFTDLHPQERQLSVAQDFSKNKAEEFTFGVSNKHSYVALEFNYEFQGEQHTTVAIHITKDGLPYHRKEFNSGNKRRVHLSLTAVEQNIFPANEAKATNK